MRWRTRILVAAIGLAAGASFVPDVDALAPGQTGWWWVGRSGGLPTPPPAEVPEDGLYVAGDPTGAQAVSALRFVLGRGAEVSTLRLRVASMSGAPLLLMCPAEAPWEPAEGGDWADRPTVDCDERAVPGTVADDGSEVVFDVHTLAGDGVMDVVIVPARDPSLDAAGATFSLALERPDERTLEVLATEEPASPASTDEPSSTPPGATGGAAGPASAPPAPEFVVPTGGDANRETTGGFGSGAPALVPAPSALARRPLATGGDDTATRVLGVLLLGSLVLIAVMVASKKDNRFGWGVATGAGGGTGIDPVDTGEVRGIGDFRSARQGSPPSVR